MSLRDAHARLEAAHDVHEGRIAFLDAFEGQDYRLHHHGYEILGVDSYDGAEERTWGNADDCERMVIEMNDFADHVRVGAEAAGPEAVAEHYVWIGVQGLIWLLVKCVADRRMNA